MDILGRGDCLGDTAVPRLFFGSHSWLCANILAIPADFAEPKTARDGAFESADEQFRSSSFRSNDCTSIWCTTTLPEQDNRSYRRLSDADLEPKYK